MTLEDVRCPRCSNEDTEFIEARNAEPGPGDTLHCENCNYDGDFEEFREEFDEKHGRRTT